MMLALGATTGRDDGHNGSKDPGAGLGNVIMGDEGVGVHVVRALEKHPLPSGVECLDGGTGGFILLEPLAESRPHHSDRRHRGRQSHRHRHPYRAAFSRDYPPTLTAHDIGIKDLLDLFYMQDGGREVTLYAITIDPQQPISLDLSDECRGAVDVAVWQILQELVPSPAAA